MEKLELPKVSERIIGMTAPEDGCFFVCDYDEVFKISLEGNSEPDVLEDDPYEFLEKLPYSLGVYNNSPALVYGESTIKYNFNSTEEFVTVQCLIAGKQFEINFRTLSGDWFSASFSKCGKFLVLAEPYGYEIYKVDASA